MANNRVSVVVDIKAQADSLNQIINQSKKNLQTLSPNMDPKQANALMKQFDTLQNRIDTMKTKFASGLNTQAAFNKASQDVRRFGEEYNNIISKIQGLGIDPNKIVPKTEKVQAELKKLTDLYQQQGEVAGQKYGQSINKELNKEMRKAAQSGNTKAVQDLGKKAVSDLTAQNRSLIAQRGQVTKFYGQDAEKKIQAELANQRNILATQGQGAQQAQAQKFGKNIGQLENDLKIVNQHKAYQQQHLAITQATQGYAQQATQLSNLQIQIDATTGKINVLSQSARTEAANALNQLGGSTQQVSNQTQSMNVSLEQAAQKFQQLDARAKSMSQFKSYFAYFFSVGSMINYTSRAIRNAIKDFKELDKLFNEISIVTGTTMTELWDRFANLNKMAQEYGVTTKDVVSVQKLYYQQGRSTAEITRLTGETLKFAKVSGLEFADATNYMTSVINAYKIAAEDAAIVTDTFASLSANAAVDSKELAVAISKTASLAANAGSDFQDTSVFLAKIIETTREAPETAGTALKTIIARFSEVKDLTEDEAELLDEDYNFNNIEKALKTVGVQTKDTTGQIRGFSEIINDLGPIWKNLTTNQQRYIATAAAGARQQSRFIALMDDWARTQELQGIAEDSAGTGAKQLALALESVETATNKLKSTWQEFYSNFLNTSMIKGFINMLNTLLSVLNKLGQVPVLGPGLMLGAVTALGILVKKAFVFGKSFGTSFAAGKIAAESEIDAAHDAANLAKQSAVGSAEGGIKGASKATTQATIEEQIEAAKAELDIIQAKEEGMFEGGAKGKAMAIAQQQAYIRTLQGQKANPLGYRMGGFFGGVKNNNNFFKGMRHPFKTMFHKDPYRMAQAKQLKGAAGPVMASNVGLQTAGGASVASTAGAGVAGIVGSALGIAAIAAIIIVIIKAAIEKIQAKVEENILKATEKTTENINNSIKKISDTSKNYNKALELQVKGLTRTKDEMEEYNSSLQALKETYPQLVKTMSDGTLELAANADSLYQNILQKERANITQQTESQFERADKGSSVSSGIALTEESKTLQENIKTTAANLSSLTKDSLAGLGLEGVKLKKLNEMAEKGVNRQTLNKAVGRSMGIERYNNLLDAMAAGGGYDRGEDSKEWRMMEYLAKQNGLTIQKFAKTLKEGTDPSEQYAKAIAESYAAEVDTTLSSVISKGAIRVTQDDKDSAEAKIQAYFYSNSNQRESFEKYAESMLDDMNIEEALKEIDSEKIKKDFDFSRNAAELASEALKGQQEVFEDSLAHQAEKYEDAVGKSFAKIKKDKDGNILSLDITDEYFKDMSITEITGYVNAISQVANKYGKDAAEVFRTRHQEFRDETLKGNEELQKAFTGTKFFDNSSIAETGAKFIQLTGNYQDFLDEVNKTSDVTDRAYRNLEQFANDVSSDIKGLKTSMEQLGNAVNGELELKDAIKLIGKTNGKLSMSDFTATPKGFKLSEAQARKAQQDILDLKVNQYKLEMALNKAKLQVMKQELLAELELVKMDKLSAKTEISKVELSAAATKLNATEAEVKSAVAKINEGNLQLLLAQIEGHVLNNEVLQGEAKILYTILEESGLLVKTISMIELQKVIDEAQVIIDHVSQLTFEFDNTNTAIGRTIKKLEKLLELLEKIDYYSDVDAYLDELQLKIDSLDFNIEFTSNVETFAEATKEKILTMNEQISANLAKSNKAEERTAAFRKDLETTWGQYVGFDKDGNILTNGSAIKQWAEKIADMAASSDKATQQQAEQEEQRFEMLLDQIDAYREEKKLITESKNEAKKLLQETEKLTTELRENVTEMEEKFIELFITRDEEIVDNLEERYEKMKEMDEDYLDSVRDAIDEERRLRDQSKAYEDVAQMERKLALLQMGGGSAVEIQKLQEEIKDARQDIADTEQDNILDSIEKENEKRAEAMDEEVEYQRAALEQKKEDRRLYNEEMKILMTQDKETIMNTWKALDKEWEAATEINKQLMEKNMNELLKSGLGSAESLADDGIKLIEDAYVNVKESGIDEVDSAMNTYVNTVSVGSDSAVSSIKDIENAYFNAGEAAEKLIGIQNRLNAALGQTVEIQKNNSKFEVGTDDIPKKTYSHAIEQIATGTTGGKMYKVNGKWYNSSALDAEELSVGSRTNIKQGGQVPEVVNGRLTTKYVPNLDVGAQYDNSKLKNINGANFDPYNGKYFYKALNGKYVEFDFSNHIYGRTTLAKALKNFNIDGYVTELQNGSRLYKTNTTVKGMELYLNQTALNGILGYDADAQLYKLFNLKAYARGGMVDFTGPAWVDGTKSRPEAFLSANDTQLIASLRDILRAGISPTAFAATALQKSGDTYYTIHINVDELGDGYSVDDLVEEMEQRILEATGQNNVVRLI